MRRQLPRAVLICGPACVALGCSTSDGGEPATDAGTADGGLNPASDEPEPGSLPVSVTGLCNNLLRASDIPFATAVFAVTDACPSQRRGAAPLPSSTVADVARAAPGKYCVSGVLTEGFATLVVSFDHINDMPAPAFHGPLDAPAFGITWIRFELESPPLSGLMVSLSNVVGDACPFSSDECIQSGFHVLNAAGLTSTITQPGTYTQRLADHRLGPGSAAGAVNTARLAGLGLELEAGNFNLCVSDVELLDAAGNPVSPPVMDAVTPGSASPR